MKMAKKKKETKVVPSLPDRSQITRIEDCWRELVLCNGKLCVVVDSDPEILDLVTGETESFEYGMPVKRIRLTEIHWEYVK